MEKILVIFNPTKYGELLIKIIPETMLESPTSLLTIGLFLMITVTLILLSILTFTTLTMDVHLLNRDNKLDTVEYEYQVTPELIKRHKIRKLKKIGVRFLQILNILVILLIIYTSFCMILGINNQNRKVKQKSVAEYTQQYSNYVNKHKEYFKTKQSYVNTIYKYKDSNFKYGDKITIENAEEGYCFTITPKNITYTLTTVDAQSEFDVYEILKKQTTPLQYNTLEKINEDTYQILTKDNEILTIPIKTKKIKLD